MSEHEFKPGDIVTWNANAHGYGRDQWVYGTLSRVTETSVTIKPEGGGRAVIMKINGIGRRWRFRGIPKAIYARVLWERRRPPCSVIAPEMCVQGLKISATIDRDRARIDAAIVELTALHQWLLEEPQP